MCEVSQENFKRGLGKVPKIIVRKRHAVLIDLIALFSCLIGKRTLIALFIVRKRHAVLIDLFALLSSFLVRVRD